MQLGRAQGFHYRDLLLFWKGKGRVDRKLWEFGVGKKEEKRKGKGMIFLFFCNFFRIFRKFTKSVPLFSFNFLSINIF